MSLYSADPAINDFPASVEAVLRHLRESTSLPNWALTREGVDGSVVLFSSVKNAGVRGRTKLDRRKYAAVLSAAVHDERYGVMFGSLLGYVTERDVADIDIVYTAVKQRAKVHQPLVDLLASLLASSLSVERTMAEGLRRQSHVRAAGRDALTGLYDRASWVELVAEESERLCRIGDPAAVVLIDVVDLPRAHAEQGVEEADLMARYVASVVRAATRDCDVVARLRSQEFGVVLLGSDATTRAVSLNAELAALPFQVSCGLAEHTNSSLALADTLARADANLTVRSVFPERRHALDTRVSSVPAAVPACLVDSLPV